MCNSPLLQTGYKGVNSETLLDCFVGGLQKEIRRDVLAHAPTTLMHCVSLAKFYEEKYGPKTHPTFKYHTKPQTQATPIGPSSSQTLKSANLPPLLPKPNTNPSPPFKHASVHQISPAEMRLRREKGMCFTCDEKFIPSHRCPN